MSAATTEWLGDHRAGARCERCRARIEPARPRRTLTLMDGMILVAATALALTIHRWSFPSSPQLPGWLHRVSLAVFLLWVYYSAMIFLLGAEFTQVYARTRGSDIRPDRRQKHDGQSSPDDPPPADELPDGRFSRGEPCHGRVRTAGPRRRWDRLPGTSR